MPYELSLLISIIAISACIYLWIKTSKNEKKENSEIAKSLKDELIYNDIEKTAITLEEAEAGYWDVDIAKKRYSDNVNQSSSEWKRIGEVLNYLSDNYTEYMFSEEEQSTIVNLKVFKKYSQTSFPYMFISSNNHKLSVVTPEDEINYVEASNKNQLFYWLKHTNIEGHYFFDDHLLTELVKSENKNLVTKAINLLPKKNYSLEYLNDNIFIKTSNTVTCNEIITLEKVVKSIIEKV